MTTRTRYIATYDFPGLLFPESSEREVAGPTWDDVLAGAPENNHWYAATVRAVTEQRYLSDDSDSGQPREEAWVATNPVERVDSWVIGDVIHVDDIPDTPEFEILRGNIRANTTDGRAVKTRIGNWQLAQDYGHVIAASEATKP